MKINVIVFVLLGIVMAGCAKMKDDFAGISFDTTKTELERKGFICSSESDCKNFDQVGTMFGYATKGVRTSSVTGNNKLKCISVELPSNVAQMQDLLALITKIGSVYTHIPKRDMKGSSIFSSDWKRSDGSNLRLTVSTGIPGVLANSATLTACNLEWQKVAEKDDASKK